MPDWLELVQREAPLLIAFPHTGTEIPETLEADFVTPWLARKDADWWVDRLYAFAAELGATTLKTTISRSVIDANRDPSGASLYPGRATTGLCPATTFDGEALYREGRSPDAGEIGRRREIWHAPYHAALGAELVRLRDLHEKVVLFDAHSIRSRIPRLFAGELPVFSIGTYDGRSCDSALAEAVAVRLAASGLPVVVNGRFKGGWTTRRWGAPARGVHALQLELACRGYMAEPAAPSQHNWPSAFDTAVAAPLQAILAEALAACLAFAGSERRP